MRFLIRSLIVVVCLGGLGAAAYQPAVNYWKERNRPEYRFADVSVGKIVSLVNSTGTVEPILSVQVGAVVSGPVKELYVDFNDKVSKGDLLAEIDPRLYNADVARDRAILATRKADVERVKAQLQQAVNDEKRAQALRDEREDFISDTEMDQFRFNRMSLEAQLSLSQASVEQAQGSLENSEANLAYTKILSPVDGIVIERKIDPGQSLASQFQAPELFTIGPELDQRVHIFASVDEADIGLIRQAQQHKKPVTFTVDAYPNDLFEGEIFQIRMSSTRTQNVVTYPVVVLAPNPELKLLPGMTASLSFEVQETSDSTVRIPNAALRFLPEREQIHPDDRLLLDGEDHNKSDDQNSERNSLSASERTEANKAFRRRHVWVKDGEFLKAIEVTTGISDRQYTEMVSGDLKDTQRLVTGVKPKK